jgi:hypothetical protein
MKKFVIYIVISASIVSCKTITVEQEKLNTTQQNITLGTIGERKDFLLEQDYNSTALPFYSNPIKINFSVLNFSTSSYKAFSKANNNKTVPLQFTYADSSAHKAKYLKLEIADRVAVLDVLNDAYNESIKNYIHNKKDAHVISAISIAIGDIKMKAITEADVLFLEQEGKKNYIIKAYKNKQLTMSLKFSDGVVFAYQASNFCWQENEQHQLDIVDIVESTDKCPNKTYRSAKRAKKEIDYFKF